MVIILDLKGATRIILIHAAELASLDLVYDMCKHTFLFEVQDFITYYQTEIILNLYNCIVLLLQFFIFSDRSLDGSCIGDYLDNSCGDLASVPSGTKRRVFRGSGEDESSGAEEESPRESKIRKRSTARIKGATIHCVDVTSELNRAPIFYFLILEITSLQSLLEKLFFSNKGAFPKI